MIAAAEAAGLPLIELRKVVPFVSVMQAINSMAGWGPPAPAIDAEAFALERFRWLSPCQAAGELHVERQSMHQRLQRIFELVRR